MNQETIEKLEAIINQEKVMLFMKGTPEMPACGFSAKAIEILIDQGIYFETFDIYANEEVRQALKEYKQWPTYPQLYINGALIWGLDIMLEMQEEGEFDSIKKELGMV